METEVPLMDNTRAFQPARIKKELYRRFPSLALPLLSLEDVIPDLSSNSNYNLYDKSDSFISHRHTDRQ